MLNNRFGYSNKLNLLCSVTSMEFSETVTVKIYENTPKKHYEKDKPTEHDIVSEKNKPTI